MTRYSLLTTASVAVLALALASPALAGPNDFANTGSGFVANLNVSFGTDQDDQGGDIPAGGNIVNDIDVNSYNTYKRTDINVTAINNQSVGEKKKRRRVILQDGGGTPQLVSSTDGGGSYGMGMGKGKGGRSYGNSIDTSGGFNKQEGGDASGADASASAAAVNINGTDISGGDAQSSGASASNSADTDGSGGAAVNLNNNQAIQFGDASGNATSANGPESSQNATAQNGDNNGGNGGSGVADDQGPGGGSSNVNETMSGDALAEATGGNTEGDQEANGGDVGSGDGLVDGLTSAAGAYALTGASGAFGVGNSANAIAANVKSISTN